jgi:CheY-like chemotaxis protein
VLVVDDNADALESLSRLVAVMGNEVCKAHDGLEAVESAESFRPHIVLMDLGMPRLDGYEPAKRMRQAPWEYGLTIVATTGRDHEEHRRRAREAGFDHHLVKPIRAKTRRRSALPIHILGLKWQIWPGKRCHSGQAKQLYKSA